MADISHNSTNDTLIALDIAKKHHDALIQLPSGKTISVRITNTLEGYQRLLSLAKVEPSRIIVGFEPTSDYHRNIAYWLSCYRQCKNDPLTATEN
ncbi:IS110 family transposase [Idiomarina seosinensis]|uniref:IS110 family transposase n=1 Tax=Idiomarina seosinensis TaxID=281739 RepID=UPI00384CA6C1